MGESGVRRRSRSASAQKERSKHGSRDERPRHVATAARAGYRQARSESPRDRDRDRDRRRERERDSDRERRSDHDKDERDRREGGSSRVTLTARSSRDTQQERSRSRDTQPRQERADDTSKGGGRGFGGGKGGKGKGGGRGGNVKPLPRPGFDEDQRLEKIEDDPRYFEGAEIGKAQLAALGRGGLSGRNTASFYPSDTLVRPAMRLFYGRVQKRCEEKLRDDDVMVVPDFLCPEGSFDVYEKLLEEVKTLQKSQQKKAAEADSSTAFEELESAPLFQRAVAKMCKYFSIGDGVRGVRLVWYQGDSADEKPFMYESGKFKQQLAKRQNCLASISLGATREVAMRRSGNKGDTEELMYFPQSNGALSFFGRDVCRRYQQGMNTCLSKIQPKTVSGHVCISVIGFSDVVSETTGLTPAPSDLKRGDEAYDGRLDVPCHNLPRPQIRCVVAPPGMKKYNKTVSHDDVIIVPDFFCQDDDWTMYYQLLKEMRESQAAHTRNSDWISWHEGAHLLSKNADGSRTFNKALQKLCEYFAIAEGNRGTRFNWYRDGSDWKPFHHDSAAFNAQRARTQNCTVGLSLGANRELAFRHAKTGELIYAPQKNGMLFYMGRDVNIYWQHGINALPENEQDGKGRISIICWGLCTQTVEEKDSPPLLTDDARDGAKGQGKGKGKGKGDAGPCRDFSRGACTYGDRCRFSHGK